MTNPKTPKPPMSGAFAQALARHKAAQAPIDAHFGSIGHDVLANQLFDAESDALKALAEAPCANDAEFIEKLHYLLGHEVRIADAPPDGRQEFGSILVAVDRHFKSASTRLPIGERGVDWGSA